jgi:predicted nucleotidyltransferase component of viral defense system
MRRSTLRMLAKEARELGFVRDAFEKMSRLMDILGFLNAEPELGSLLAIKGGTAINLTVFNLPRLSVDIDLDFTENLTRAETKERRERIHELLGRYMAAEGYKVSHKSKHSYALDSFVYSYTNAAGNHDNIKVETNYMLRCHALPPVETTTRVTEAFAVSTIRTLAPVEIFAGKIAALLNRAAARDLYDILNMVDSGIFDEPDLTLLRKCTVLYLALAGGTESHKLSFHKMSEMTERTIRTDLYPMIRTTGRFDLTEAKARVSAFLTKLFVLTEKEAGFLQRFSKGHYEPQLLFENAEIVDRVRNHPMAAWRTQRIKEKQQER